MSTPEQAELDRLIDQNVAASEEYSTASTPLQALEQRAEQAEQVDFKADAASWRRVAEGLQREVTAVMGANQLLQQTVNDQAQQNAGLRDERDRLKAQAEDARMGHVREASTGDRRSAGQSMGRSPRGPAGEGVRETMMDSQLRASLMERLSHRADRLARCAALSHPASRVDGVIAMMAAHVTRTAMALLGETFAREMWSHMFDAMAETHGICRFCRARPLREDRTMCQVCWDQAASDDEITDDELVVCVDEALGKE